MNEQDQHLKLHGIPPRAKENTEVKHGLRLNLGAGINPREWPHGFINVDVVPTCAAPEYFDQTDLNIFPWKWATESVEEIRCWSAMEHMSDRWKAIQECYRILRPGGILDLRVPHAHGIYAHSLDHTNYWSRLTFVILEAANPMNGNKCLFQRMKYRVRVRHCAPMPILDSLATRFPYFWESIGIFPPAMIHWIGKKI